MDFKKIATIRVDGPAAGGNATKLTLNPRRGGRTAKVAQYMIVVNSLSSDQAKVGLILEHGPDGQHFKTHSTPLANTQLTGADASLLVGDADVNKILGEWLRVTLTCISNDANPCWALVEVYEMRKPF